VKLSRTGFSPLVATYTFIFVMQAALVIFLVEVLQRARAEFQMKKSSDSSNLDDLPLVSAGDMEVSDLDSDTMEPTMVIPLEVEEPPVPTTSKAGTSLSKGEDLHSLSVAYLGPILQKLFNGAITLHFISLLITYTLAASESYGQLMGLHLHWIWLSIPFVLIWSNVVIFGAKYLDPVISIFTFAKAGLLVLMVVITALVSADVNQHISNDWKYIGRPFLIGTVALGGCYNIIPVAFEKVRFHAKQIKIFTACSLAGLTLVYLFNLAWCYFVLRIVPQMPSSTTPAAQGAGEGEVMTLWDAEQQGQISTVPLVNIIRLDHPRFRWIATIVMLFTMVSITVSFIVNSMAWKHYVEGLLESWTPVKESANNYNNNNNGRIASFWRRTWLTIRNMPINWKRAVAFSVSFTFVLSVALFNPKSFLKIMEKVTSFAANGTAAGVCWILHRSRQVSPVLIPWSLPDVFWKARWPVMIFFLGAMLYNIVATITEAAGVTWL